LSAIAATSEPTKIVFGRTAGGPAWPPISPSTTSAAALGPCRVRRGARRAIQGRRHRLRPPVRKRGFAAAAAEVVLAHEISGRARGRGGADADVLVRGRSEEVRGGDRDNRQPQSLDGQRLPRSSRLRARRPVRRCSPRSRRSWPRTPASRSPGDPRRRRGRGSAGALRSVRRIREVHPPT